MLNMVEVKKYLLGNVKAVNLSAVGKRIQFRVKLTIVNLDTMQWVDVCISVLQMKKVTISP